MLIFLNYRTRFVLLMVAVCVPLTVLVLLLAPMPVLGTEEGEAAGVAAAEVLASPYALEAAPVMLHTAVTLRATTQQTSVPTLDTEAIMGSVNEGVSYGFQFATAFTPLITIIIGFAVAGAIIGVLFALGPKIAKMIKNAL